MLSTSLPKTARNDLAIEPQKLYPEMFEAIKAGNWEKFNNATSLLTPLSTEVSQTNTTQLKFASIAQDAFKAKKYLIAIIAGGVKKLLNSSLTGSTITKKESIRQGFAEYMEIHNHIKEAHPNDSAIVMSTFKVALNQSDDAMSFKSSIVTITTKLHIVVT